MNLGGDRRKELKVKQNKEEEERRSERCGEKKEGVKEGEKWKSGMGGEVEWEEDGTSKASSSSSIETTLMTS